MMTYVNFIVMRKQLTVFVLATVKLRGTKKHMNIMRTNLPPGDADVPTDEEVEEYGQFNGQGSW